MGAETAVLSFLYSLLLSMGLIGGSYSDIANAFPDNSSQENQILYSLANDPTRNAGGFEFKQAGEDGATGDPVLDTLLYPLNPYQTLPGSPNDGYLGSETARANWDALMEDLGFYIVNNNVDVAIDNGYSVNGAEWVGTMSNGEDTVIVSFVGTCALGATFVQATSIPENVGFEAGWVNRNIATSVWRFSYGEQVYYSTSPLYGSVNTSITLVPAFTNGHFETNNNILQFVYYNGSNRVAIDFTIDAWINNGIAVDDAATYYPTESEAVGEEFLSFGDEDNPVVSVSYDPATGVTTYQYKDGTTSTTPPVAIGDTIALSPSITKPMTQYIINEGDVTNIYNPDAAIPSDSSVPFDFTALGQLLNQTFIPTIAFPYTTIYNRLMNKATFLTVITDIGVKLKNITPKRPEYYFYGVDIFQWIDTIGTANFQKIKSLIAFALKVSMLLGSIALVMKTFHVGVKESEG